MATTKKIPKKIKTGINAVPVDNFFSCKHYFHHDLDKKYYGEIVKEYVKKNLAGAEQKCALNAPEFNYTGYSHIAATIYWKNVVKKDFPANWDAERCITDWMNRLIEQGKSELPVDEVKTEVVVSPQQRLENKVNDTVLTELDTVLDEWTNGKKSTFDLYSLMKKYELTSLSIPYIQPVIEQLLAEYNDAVNKTCEQAVEAYAHISKAELTRRIGIFEKMLADLESVKMESKARRAPRQKKPRAADKQVSKVKFQKEDRNFKLVSIVPTQIVGAMRLFVFNTATRKLTEYVTTSTKGFEISGTTIKNFDIELSRTTTLRKPEEILPVVLKKTPNQISKEWDKLTTKNSVPNGRLNETTILLRVFDR